MFSAMILPQCCSIICWVNASPSPVPGLLAGVCTVESGEDVRELHFVHAGTVVGNVDYPVFVVLSDVDQDGAAFGTVVDGVADDVVEGAVQVAFVGKDGCVFGDFPSADRATVCPFFWAILWLSSTRLPRKGRSFRLSFPKPYWRFRGGTGLTVPLPAYPCGSVRLPAV